MLMPLLNLALYISLVHMYTSPKKLQGIDSPVGTDNPSVLGVASLGFSVASPSEKGDFVVDVGFVVLLKIPDEGGNRGPVLGAEAAVERTDAGGVALLVAEIGGN